MSSFSESGGSESSDSNWDDDEERELVQKTDQSVSTPKKKKYSEKEDQVILEFICKNPKYTKNRAIRELIDQKVAPMTKHV